MAASVLLITTQGTVRTVEPWLPETSESWRVKGQNEQYGKSCKAQRLLLLIWGEREVPRKICICLWPL